MIEPAENNTRSVDIIELVGIGLAAKRRILGFSFAAAVAAFALSFLFKPIYRAEILLLNSPAERRSGNVLSGLGSGGSGLASLAGLGSNADSNTQEALAVLKSRALIDDFVTERNLLPQLFKSRWNTVEQRWKSSDSWLYAQFANEPSLGDAYERFNKQIRRVEEDRKSGLVTLSIEWSDPMQAADWAAQLVSRANSRLRSTALERSEKSLDFLYEQAKKTGEIEVRQAIYKLIDTELKREMFAKVNEDYAFKVIDPAFVPEKKISPKRSLFAVLGFVIGGALTFGITLKRRQD